MDMTAEQRAAFTQMKAGKRIGGYAGTGKTTVIAERCAYMDSMGDGAATVAAPTNKAAQVLRSKLAAAGAPAIVTTLHALTTTPSEVEEEDEHGRKELKRIFSPKEEAVRGLVIIDEASMIGARFWGKISHLLTNCVLVGDPMQLPPVRDTELFREEDCDVILTQVMRTAAEAPALAYATQIRTSGETRVSAGVEKCGGLDIEQLRALGRDDTACIVYTNHRRGTINKLYRSSVLKQKSWRPVEGEKVVSHEADLEHGIFNGQAGRIAEVEAVDDDSAVVHIDFDGAPQRHRLVIDARRLMGKDVHYEEAFGHHVEYGYAITCHKAQGSEWSSVFVVPEGKLLAKRLGREGALRWLYTAVTRTSDRLTIVTE